MLQVLALDEAKQMLLNLAKKRDFSTERAQNDTWRGRVLAKTVTSPEDLP